jgi:hypothetical protein
MERFYELMHKKHWGEIFSHVKAMQAEIKKHQSEWDRICEILSSEFILYAAEEKPVLVAKLCKQYLRLNIGKYIKLNAAHQNDIEMIGLQALIIEDERAIPDYVSICSVNSKVLRYHSKTKAQPFSAKAREVKSTPIKHSMTHWLSPLFKSEQEHLFYKALQSVFPTFIIYPNVVISNIFDLGQIKAHLTDTQQRFYFNGVIDFVVYDADGLQDPLYFFELDSSYHDTEDAKRRDGLKDGIFAAANIPLHRIRLHNKTLTTTHDFKGMIRFAINPPSLPI